MSWSPSAFTALELITFSPVAQTFKDETNVSILISISFYSCSILTSRFKKCVVAFLDADAAPNKPIAERYEVKSYPTIKFFPKIYKPVKGRKPKTPPTPEQITKANTKVVQDYNGGRSEADLVDFLNLKCNTFRAVGGGLNDRVSIHTNLLCCEMALMGCYGGAGRAL